MNKENIEQIEKIGAKFGNLPLILIILTTLIALLVSKFKIQLISIYDVFLIGFCINLFYKNIVLKLQMKSLLRILKNDSK